MSMELTEPLLERGQDGEGENWQDSEAVEIKGQQQQVETKMTFNFQAWKIEKILVSCQKREKWKCVSQAEDQG